MKKYGPKAQEKVERAVHEMKKGELTSGRSGKKVTSRKQAIAIGLSEAREAGAKVPKKASSSQRTTAKTSAKAATTVSKKTAAPKKKTTGAKKSAPARSTGKEAKAS